MDKAELELRKGIIAACLRMNSEGINQGTSGNISARYGSRMLITPTSVPYDELRPQDIMSTEIAGDGSKWHGPLKPSSEWRFHLDIMRSRPEFGGIVHTHSIYATALAICNKPLPGVHYMVAAGGGRDVRVAPYATYGTQELSDNAIKALEGRNCCLLSNHGVIACGSSVKKALWLAGEIETLAKQYFLSMQIGGARILPEAELDKVVMQFKGYGMQDKPKSTAAAKAAQKPKKVVAKATTRAPSVRAKVKPGNKSGRL
jgi:L-fuculose-phosphate aldolase